MCSIIEASGNQGYSMSLVSERMKCDLHQAMPALLSLRERLLICLDVAKALLYLHKEGMIHRDVKTQNVLVCLRTHIFDIFICSFDRTWALWLNSSSIITVSPSSAQSLCQIDQSLEIRLYKFKKDSTYTNTKIKLNYTVN